MTFIFLAALTFILYFIVLSLKEKPILPEDRPSRVEDKSSYNIFIQRLRFYYPVGALLCWSIFILCCFTTIRPGEVGVVVNMLGEVKGAENKEKGVGIHFIPPWKTIYRFPIYEQNHQWTENDSFTFQTSEGLPVSAEIGITYHLQPSKIHHLFARYRRGMEEITHMFIKNHLRDYINRHASKMKIEDLIGNKKEEFFQDVQKSVQSELDDLGFVITHVYTIGQFHIPDNVKKALNDKIAATQRAQQRENELREAEAQARKVIAETEGNAKSKLIKADAEAKANDMLAKSITKELLEWNSINKWDGKLPYAMSGQGMPFILSLPPTK